MDLMDAGIKVTDHIGKHNGHQRCWCTAMLLTASHTGGLMAFANNLTISLGHVQAMNMTANNVTTSVGRLQAITTITGKDKLHSKH